MLNRPSFGFRKPILAAFLAAAAALPVAALPLRNLAPERFEATRLFRDWKLAAKRELPQPLRRGQPQSRAFSYTFSPSQGGKDGLSVVLFQRQTGQGAAYATTHMIIYWKREEDPKAVLAGPRRLQVHRILASLDLAASEDRVLGALAEAGGSRVDLRSEVKVPAPHQVTVFRVQAHDALGFEVRCQGEQP
jgi:hypothetical protein